MSFHIPLRGANSPRAALRPALLAVLLSVPLLLAALWTPATALAEAKARAIMQRVQDRDDGDNMTADMEMILIDKKNNRRNRSIKTFSKDKVTHDDGLGWEHQGRSAEHDRQPGLAVVRE